MYILELESIFNNEGSQLAINHKVDMSDYDIAGVHPISVPVKVTGAVKNKTGIVTIEANAKVTYKANCDRCATPVEREYNIKVNHTLVTQLNDDSNDDFTIIKTMRLDLDEMVKEDVLLYLPVKFLCKDDCKGLCPMCGQNLNEASCSCEKPIDPRLEVLKQLLDK